MTSAVGLHGPSPLEGAALADGHAGTAGLRRSIGLRTVAALLAVLVCYHTSLWTLLRGITVDTPLAYLGLVPLMAAGVGWYLARPAPGEPPIHDRHLDLIIGVPLLVVALAALSVLPPRLGTMYWLWRIDLLTFPLFVAGVVAILFGARMLWRTKAAVLLLFLAWPIPFRGLVTRLLEPLAESTARGVTLLMRLAPLAVPVGGDGVTFEVAHGDAFLVTIASACSGANGLLGFLLIGSALALVMSGPRWRKGLWLATGLALVWVLNVARIVAILAVGRLFGERTAIDVLHPFVGILTFNVAALVMLANVRRFGLSPRVRVGDRATVVARAVPRAGAALAVVVALSLVGGWYNHQLLRYDPIASSVGTTSLLPFKFGGIEVPGGRAQAKSHFEHGKRFFGESSTWVRYAYRYTGEGPLRTNVPVLVDVVNTDDLQSFSDFGIEACYRFHGFATSQVTTVDLGHGIQGNLLRWTDSDTDIDWVSLYWIWPVRQGDVTRFERVVLLLNLDRNLQVTVPDLPEAVAADLGLDDHDGEEGSVVGTGPGSVDRATDRDVDAFLTGWALDVVDATVERSREVQEAGDAN